MAVWWSGVLGGMLPASDIGVGTKVLALGGGGLVTAFVLVLQVWVGRLAREDRRRLRRLAEEVIGEPG